MELKNKTLDDILRQMRVEISEKERAEILEYYGHGCIDNDGIYREFSEQDIHEQLRKRLRRKKEKHVKKN